MTLPKMTQEEVEFILKNCPFTTREKEYFKQKVAGVPERAIFIKGERLLNLRFKGEIRRGTKAKIINTLIMGQRKE